MKDRVKCSDKIVDLQEFRKNTQKNLRSLTTLRAMTAIAHGRELLGPYLDIDEIAELSAVMEAYELKLSSYVPEFEEL